jgi:16S rRNA (adenine1518-N6/adenine1519-N6)-dimethyltransferase
MNLSEMKRLLVERDIRLTKSMGQNFLHDGNQLSRIVQAAELEPRDQVLEIGPGLGPLTEHLVAPAGSVLAVELDRRLAEFLKDRFAECSKLTIVQADALQYVRNSQIDWTHWKLVSNLPYSVASPILVELALNPRPPQLMVATLQYEVARRLAAQPGQPDYGVLTLLAQLRYEAGGLFKIPPSCFFPSPEVDSACLTLTRRPRLLLPVQDQTAFVRIVKRGFSQRRKMMFKVLKTDWPEEILRGAFDELRLSPQIRAEKVALEQFVALTMLLLKGRS